MPCRFYKASFHLSLRKNSKMDNIVMPVCIGLSYTSRRKRSRIKEKKKPFLLKMLEIEFLYHHIVYKQNVVEEAYAT